MPCSAKNGTVTDQDTRKLEDELGKLISIRRVSYYIIIIHGSRVKFNFKFAIFAFTDFISCFTFCEQARALRVTFS